MKKNNIHFDRQDYEFLTLINKMIHKDQEDGDIFYSNLHPNGIIELAVPPEQRIASAVLHLLDSLTRGLEEERLSALRALRDEVLVSARTEFRHNTARVLIQIMKEIIRNQGNEQRQLRLVHDFRRAATGKPQIVRRLLRRYHLLEMPEEWNQAVFDHHVHDSNTKGRKNPTHLIMDAWIKGIRSLTVIYYHYVEPAAARELMKAAQIMGVTIRIGLLFHAPFRGRLVDFIWVPRGFADAEGFLEFLAMPNVRALMDEGRLASKWFEKKILEKLEFWNNGPRLELENLLSIVPAPLQQDAFLAHVASGQASMLHLADFIHKSILPMLSYRARTLRETMAASRSDSEEYRQAENLLRQLDSLTPDYFLDELYDAGPKTETADLDLGDCSDYPDMLQLSPLVLLDWLTSLHSGNRIILNLANLTPEDVLNLLWDCQGMISHLELFNLKDWQEGKEEHIKAINELQLAINHGSAPRLKQIIRIMMRNCQEDPRLKTSADLSEQEKPDNSPAAASFESCAKIPDCAERVEKLRVILRKIQTLLDFYKSTKLYSRMGTDSSSRPGRHYGMGLVYPESLPPRARRELKYNEMNRLRLPLRTQLLEKITYHNYGPEDHPSRLTALIRRLPGLRNYQKRRERDWVPLPEFTYVCNDGECSTDTAIYSKQQGNILTLGGLGGEDGNAFLSGKDHKANRKSDMIYLNGDLANLLKILGGFIPAFIAFHLTQDGVLAWLGAVLWFAITGLRNIFQAVLGSGGFKRSPLMRWRNYVSWSRICDSLMYTGFSVVLLELIVRRWLLEDAFGVTAASNPLLAFTVISIINGFYIAAHNYARGMQRSVIIANLFRSVFAIPVALLFNGAMQLLLVLAHVQNPELILLSAAAIVSKVASDTVAGVIEGLADRSSNVKLRLWDYKTKVEQIFNTYSKLEVMYPEQGVVEMLASPKKLLQMLDEDNKDLKAALIINALDMMFFWYYQPRAAYTLQRIMQRFTGSERLVLLRSQQVLSREKDVSQLLVDGVAGRKFSKPLSFYLDRHEAYLEEMDHVFLDRQRVKIAD